MQGYQIAGDQFNRAFESAGAGLQQLRDDRTAAADNSALANALRVNDEQALQQQLQGADLSGVSSTALASLGKRQQDLLSNAVTRQNLSDTQYDSQRTQANNAALDAARPLMSQLLAVRNDPRQVDALLAQNKGVFDQLSPDQQAGFLSAISGQDAKDISNTSARFNSNVAQRNDAVGQQAIAAVNEISRNSLTGLDALAGLERLNLPPEVYQRAQAALNSQFGSPTAPAAAPTTGTAPVGTFDQAVSTLGSGGAPGTAQGNPYDRTFNNNATSAPITSQNLSEVINYQKTDLFPKAGGTPVGAYQFTKDTLEDYGPRVLGENWASQKFTPENQEKLAQAIYEDRKGRNLTDTWASLPDRGVGGYKDVPWSEARKQIAAGEVSAGNLPSPEEVRAQQVSSRALQDQGNAKINELTATGSAVDYFKGLGDTATPAQAAKALIESDFTGADQGKVVDQLNRIVRESNGVINYSQAANIMARNPQQVSAVAGLAADDISGNLVSGLFSGGLGINQEGVSADIAAARSGQLPVEASVVRENQERVAMVGQAQQAVQQAEDQLRNTIRLAQANPNLQQFIPRAQAALQLARAQLEGARQKVQEIPEVNYLPQQATVAPGTRSLYPEGFINQR
jgi:hypothetical protein